MVFVNFLNATSGNGFWRTYSAVRVLIKILVFVGKPEDVGAVYKQKGNPLPCTLKTELPPPEVIQDLRTVCHEALPSAPTEELPHSGPLPIRGPKERRK